MSTQEVRKFSAKMVRKATTEQLVRQLNSLWGLTAAKLRLSSRILVELKRREYDIRILNRGSSMMRWLCLIGANSLLPEVVEAFYHHSVELVDSISRLSIGEQRALLESGVVRVLVGDSIEERPLAKITRQDIQTAFASDHIRTEEEQRALFAPKPITDKSSATPKIEERREHSYRVRPVPERKGYEVGKMFVPAEEFVHAQAEANAGREIPEVNPDSDDTMTFRLLAWEKEAINALARKSGKNAWLLIREAMWAQYGVFLNGHRPK